MITNAQLVASLRDGRRQISWKDDGFRLQAAVRIEELEEEIDTLREACQKALDDIKARNFDMKTRAQDLDGENRKALELLLYYAPNPEGATAKALRAALKGGGGR